MWFNYFYFQKIFVVLTHVRLINIIKKIKIEAVDLMLDSTHAITLDILKQRATAFDYLFDAVVVTDLNGIIIDWNKGSEKLYGYAAEEAIGQHVNVLHVPEERELIASKVISAVQNLGKWTGEVRMVRKGGSIGWIESMCVPVYDENGQIQGAIGINRDITEQKNETERLQHLAHYDYLTNIPNRYLLLGRVEHLIFQSARDQHTFALLFIDIDKFKVFNDTKGHTFGDQVLKQIALRLKQTIRNSDTVARFGGDEFVVLLEKITDRNDASMITDTLMQALGSDFIINNVTLKVDCSIGVAIYPEDGITTDTLLAAADNAMYKIKYQE